MIFIIIYYNYTVKTFSLVVLYHFEHLIITFKQLADPHILDDVRFRFLVKDSHHLEVFLRRCQLVGSKLEVSTRSVEFESLFIQTIKPIKLRHQGQYLSPAVHNRQVERSESRCVLLIQSLAPLAGFLDHVLAHLLEFLIIGPFYQTEVVQGIVPVFVLYLNALLSAVLKDHIRKRNEPIFQCVGEQ